MKAYIGVDSQSRLVHAVRVTSARMHDWQGVSDVLQGERRVYSDSAHTGQKARVKETAPKTRDFTHQRGRRHHPLTEKARQTNRTKSRIRARVEHLFAVIKHQFGYRKARYRGLSKNTSCFYPVCLDQFIYCQPASTGDLTGEAGLKWAYHLDNMRESKKISLINPESRSLSDLSIIS